MTDRRALAIVLTVPVVCWLACWPFVDMPVNDDFSYAFTVRQLLATGHLTYNGWSAPIVGAQAYWGAFVCRVFGFSHNVLRASTLPLSVAVAGLAYALYRRVGAPPRWALFATLVLVCSPLFTPWSASFMTDVPSLAFTLLTFNACAGLARARSTRGVVGWTTILTAAAIVGGTIRQTNFLFGGIALTIELIRRRRDWRALLAIGLSLVVLAATMLWLVAWYARQPYAIADVWVPINHVGRAAESMLAMGLTLTMFLFPLGVAWVRLAHVGRGAIVRATLTCAIVCAAVLYAALQLQRDPTFGLIFLQLGPAVIGLWSGNTLTDTGLLFDNLDAPGQRPILFGLPARCAMAVAVYSLLALVAGVAWRQRTRLVDRGRAILLGRSSRPSLAIASMTAMSAAYAALLFPRAGLLVIFDRYLLVVMPVVSAGVLLAYRRRLRTTAPGAIAWTLVAVYAALGSAVTFDHFAEMRGRARVAADFAALGVPRTAIANGLSFDAWTELLARNYLNEEGVRNPRGAYHADVNDEARVRKFWFLGRTPSIQPRWIVTNEVAPPATLGDRKLFEYDALLPPRQRWLLAWPIRDPAVNGGPHPLP